VSYKVSLFHPYVSKNAIDAAAKTLRGRWIGQGPKVAEFEKKFGQKLGIKNAIAVNSGTSALEIAYDLLGLKAGDEVISPVFTCAATNIPLARRGVKVVFADVKDDLMLDWEDAKKRITPKTKAIINVHLNGRKNENKDLGIPVIGDAAQYIGKTSGEDFTIYSFQATKLITTVDGGMLVCKNKADYKRAKLLRWYGIDRETKRDNIDEDIKEAGYKNHMNDVTASIGIEALKDLDRLKAHQEKLQACYKSLIGGFGGSPYLVNVKNRKKLINKLAKNGIEAGLMHRRNDAYTLFGGRKKFPNMDRVERTYLFLPCHNYVTLRDVDFISNIVKDYV
jgi:dTDP-4-amino-4,6-dideoxygalactose transaminase